MSKARVLIVEDEALAAESLRRRLYKLDYTVQSIVASGEQAIAEVGKHPPDVILMDIHLPGEMDGSEAAIHIRENYDIPIIFLASHDDDGTLSQAKISEPFGYLIKPVRDLELKTYIEIALYKHQKDQFIRESEARYRAVSELVSDFVYSFKVEPDGSSEMEWITDSFMRVTGYSTNDPEGQNWIAVIHPNDIPLVKELFKKIIKGEKSEGELRIITKDGEIRWLFVSNSPVWNKSNTLVTNVYGAAQDITLRKGMEDKLKTEIAVNAAVAQLSDVLIDPSYTVEDIANQTLEYVKQLTKSKGGFVSVIDPQGGKNIAYLGNQPEFIGGANSEHSPKMGPPPGVSAEFPDLSGLGFKTSEAFYSNEPRSHPAYKDVPAGHSAMNNFLIAPAVAGKRLVGHLVLANSEAGYSDLDLEVVTHLSELYSTAILRRQAELELEQRATELALINDIGGKIAAVLDLDSLMLRAVQLLQDRFGYHHVALFTIDTELGAAVMRARAGAFADLFPPAHQLNLGDGMVGWAAKYGKTILENDVSLAEKFVNHFPDKIPTESEISVPIKIADDIVGVLDVQSPRKDDFSENDILVLETLADLIAVAMQNASLHEAVQEELVERVRAEAERESLLAQIREIMNSVPEGVILLDEGGEVILANPIAKELLDTLAGIKEGERLIHLGDMQLPELLTSPPWGLWHEIHNNGNTYEVIARPMIDDPNQDRWVMVLRDATEERAVQEGVQRQERLASVGQLAAGIAHDFNNILAVIVLYTELTLASPDLPPDAGDRLITMSEQARRGAKLIQQILDFSRRSVLERNPMDVLAFLKTQVDLLERTLPENIRISLESTAGDYIVAADPTRLQQALMNLAFNARDAMSDNGRLNINLSKTAPDMEINCISCGQVMSGEWIKISVRDDGTGIEEENLGKIFDPFFTTKQPGEGTGLGLSQVYGIVKQHDGHITVESKMGMGSTFCIYLPGMNIFDGEDITHDTGGLFRGDGEVILVVEDEPVSRQALVDSLTQLGYKTIPMENGLQALTYLENNINKVDLVLSDVVMPEMGGIRLFQIIRERDYPVPVVLMTGHPMKEELVGLEKDGLAGWLLKPARLKQLARLVSKITKDKSGI